MTEKQRNKGDKLAKQRKMTSLSVAEAGTKKNSGFLSPKFQTGSELKPGAMADKNEVG